MSHEEEKDPRWWLPRNVWWHMTREQRVEHCVNVNAYFRSEERRRNHMPANDVQDRILAEAEIKELIRHNPAIVNAR